MKRVFLNCTIIVCLCCILAGCDSEERKGTEKNDQEEWDIYGKDTRALDDREYLIEVYGFTADELEGYDIERVSKSTGFRENNYNADELKRQFEVFKDRWYSEDGYDDTYLIFSAQPNKKIPQGTKVKKIGFYINPGTFAQKAVFDIENNIFFVDDYTEYVLDEDLSAVVDEYKVYEWETEVKFYDNSTGSYGWKMVFVAEDGHKYVYDGFTQDSSKLPNGYRELSNKLTEIIEKRN